MRGLAAGVDVAAHGVLVVVLVPAREADVLRQAEAVVHAFVYGVVFLCQQGVAVQADADRIGQAVGLHAVLPRVQFVAPGQQPHFGKVGRGAGRGSRPARRKPPAQSPGSGRAVRRSRFRYARTAPGRPPPRQNGPGGRYPRAWIRACSAPAAAAYSPTRRAQGGQGPAAQRPAQTAFPAIGAGRFG